MVTFDYPDPEMPRTIYYETLSAAIRALPACLTDGRSADLVIPQEDTALETNWPRYARPETAFLTGCFDLDRHVRYLARLMAVERRICVINMHPFIRVPLIFADRPAAIVADNNLLTWERAINPRTISMPAFPLAVGRFDPAAKRLLASFRGVMSHPCRQALLRLHDGGSIIVEIVQRQNHCGRIDALNRDVDAAYASLLQASLFAFVPRGDAEFSYRLLEVMSFGCIPVVLSDGWVLPFDRLIDWDHAAIRIPESRISEIPALLRRISPMRIAEMQAAVTGAYATRLCGFAEVASALLREADMLPH